MVSIARNGHLVVFLIACTGFLPATGRADDDEKIDTARTLLKHFLEGRLEEFVAAADDTMREQFGAAKAAQVRAGIIAQVGAFDGEDSAKLTRIENYTAVDFACRFKRGTATLRVVLDDSDRLAGFFCFSLKAQVDYDPPPYVKPERFREQAVKFGTPGLELPGKLTIPESGGPHPAVVLVHGSGPHDEDSTIGPNKPLRDLAEGLASRDVAVLRYVKRTQAHPLSQAAADWTLDTEVIDDALAAVALLRARPDVDAKRIFVAGHSMGGMAAPFIAERDPELAGIIVLAGSARSILDLIPEQIEYIARLDGRVSDEERQQLDAIKASCDAVRRGEAGSADTILGAPAKYWAHIHSFKPAEAAAKLDIPMLILQGGRDYQVTDADFAVWRKHLAGRENVTFERFDDLNHLFIAGSEPSTPMEYQKVGHVDERVITRIATWIAITGNTAP